MSNMTINLKIWRQKDGNAKGKLETYQVKEANEHMSFLELLDVLNEQLESEGQDPVAFDHDCREGICGSCGAMVNGKAHGPWGESTLCQLHMRAFKDGDTIIVEPFRAKAFPILKDLVVDRTSFDRMIAQAGFISVKTGSAPEANATLIPKLDADKAFDAAQCIGCGACVAACPNASASLFVAAKISHLSLVPQGAPEKKQRVLRMVEQMDKEGFGSCSNTYQCEAACPKGISVENIARMNREYFSASFC